MKKIKFNILLCCLSTLFFVSSSYGDEHKYKFSLVYNLWLHLFKSKDDDSQYICFVLERSSRKTLSEKDDRYQSYAKELSDIKEKYQRLTRDKDKDEDRESQYREELNEIEKKYGLYIKRNTVDQSWPVKLSNADKFEYPYLHSKPKKVSEKISKGFDIIKSLIKERTPENFYIDSREASEEEIENLVKEEGAVISNVMKNIDLVNLGGLDKSFELLSINDEGKVKVSNKFEKHGEYLSYTQVMK